MGYFIVFFIGFILAFVLTPIAEKIGIKFGAVDIPDERKVHQSPIPRVGGLSIYAAFAIAFFSGFFYLHTKGELFLVTGDEIIGIFLGGFVILLFGLADDLKSLKPRDKFIGQISAALILIFFGTRIDYINNPGNGIISLGILSIPLTIFWVVALINTFNFLDGLDGLAAGVSCIAATTFFIFSLLTNQFILALLCMAVVGSSLGFLRHNFYPAKIFMGDSGSMFLGYIIAAISIQGAIKSIALISLYMTVIIVAIPIFDTFFAIIRRIRKGKSIIEADNDHIHHRLLRKGLSHPTGVIIIYIWTVILSCAGLALKFVPLPFKLAIFVGLFIMSLLIFWYSGLYRDFF